MSLVLSWVSRRLERRLAVSRTISDETVTFA
jgi:hypothetical protein